MNALDYPCIVSCMVKSCCFCSTNVLLYIALALHLHAFAQQMNWIVCLQGGEQMPVDRSVIDCVLQGIRFSCLAEVAIEGGIHDEFLAKLLLLHCPTTALKSSYVALCMADTSTSCSHCAKL